MNSMANETVRALYIAQQYKKNQCWLIVVNDAMSAVSLEYSLKFFLGNELSSYVRHFPDWETLPYDTFSPHQDIISERLSILFQLQQSKPMLLIVTAQTLLNRLPPKSFIQKNTLLLQENDTFDVLRYRSELVDAGYQSVQQVLQAGEFAHRGSILDIFPMGSEKPFRIELFDNDIETIRTFNPETQLTEEKVTSVSLLPAHEFSFNEAAVHLFKEKWRELFDGNPLNCPMYEDVKQHIVSPGLEYFIPLFFETTCSLLDYLPDSAQCMLFQNAHQQCEKFFVDVHQRYEQLSHDITRPILKPNHAFWTVSELFAQVKKFNQVEYDKEDEPESIRDIALEPKANTPWKKLSAFLTSTSHRVLLCAETMGRREVIMAWLKRAEIKVTIVDSWSDFLKSNAPFCLTVYPLDQGFIDGKQNSVVITENELFNERIVQRRRRKSSQDITTTFIKSLAELSIGDPLVHLEHGVGRYQGLKTIDLGQGGEEYLILEYANHSNLYVPINTLHVVSRYTGSDHVPLHTLGNDQWEKAKRKAIEKIRDVAADLLMIYAKREAQKGHAFKLSDDYELFSSSFPFETTPDQQTAIDAVLNDLQEEKCMDRLVCGDVGFGKTEVALRGSFVAVDNGFQVAVLVPTTLLAQQHYETFKNRFADLPVTVDVLSRFRSAKEQAEILSKIEHGQCDIVIGTHKLLSEHIKFAKLGLLIVDEEHRFGVQQKDRIKALRANVDILTLTATPIPRTLNMAFGGLRDLSIISTPPSRRLSVKTFVRHRKKSIIQEALLREILRGGQVFFLHNDVATIERVKEELTEWIPEASVRVAHGQMSERVLEKVMVDFYHRRFNVLLTTTIIETGIDIPTANTIVIDRADKFGLAQLHQLRGRVGRSHHQAYAYLLIPDEKNLTTDAKKRLEAISQHEDLGSGFILATHDLEIRGAGELLGDDQSGHVHEIGFELYMDMLHRTVKALKQGKTIDLDSATTPPEIHLMIPAFIPETYLSDVNLRLIFYKRICDADSLKALEALKVEMIDRFGLLPDQLRMLFEVTSLKLLTQPMGIYKVEGNERLFRFYFTQSPNINSAKLIELIQTKPKTYQLKGQEKLTVHFDKPCNAEERIASVHHVIELLKLLPLK